MRIFDSPSYGKALSLLTRKPTSLTTPSTRGIAAEPVCAFLRIALAVALARCSQRLLAAALLRVADLTYSTLFIGGTLRMTLNAKGVTSKWSAYELGSRRTVAS